jgi:predicted nucleic acid-binding protein
VTSEGLTYDTGALAAAERGDRLMWSLHRAALTRGLPPVVPAGVLAEGWRGGPQASLSRLLKGCRSEELTEERAKAVGALSARSGHGDVVDVCVVEGAIRRRHAVVTSNKAHIQRIADSVRFRLEVHSV